MFACQPANGKQTIVNLRQVEFALLKIGGQALDLCRNLFHLDQRTVKRHQRLTRTRLLQRPERAAQRPFRRLNALMRDIQILKYMLAFHQAFAQGRELLFLPLFGIKFFERIQRRTQIFFLGYGLARTLLPLGQRGRRCLPPAP